MPFARLTPARMLGSLACALALASPDAWPAVDSLPVVPPRAEARNDDTLALPLASSRPAPPPPAAAKAVIVPGDVDRQLGNLGDMLQRLAGLHVLRTGGIGDWLGVSVWGSSEYQVNLYVDGVLQNQATDPSLFLSDRDLSGVERIEVYKGLAPENLPGAPMGGAINIVTRSATEGADGRVALGAGSFGSLRANGSAGWEQGHWRGRVTAAREQADGDFPYYDDDGTEFLPGRFPNGAPRRGEGDLVRKIRSNNAHGYTDFTGDIAWRPAPASEVGLSAEVSHLDKQVPAPFPDVDSTVRVEAFRASDRASGRARARWGAGNAEATADLSGSWLRDVYVDTSKAGGGIGVGYDNDRNAYGDGLASLWGRIDLGGGWSVSALAAYGVAAFFYTDRLADRTFPGLFRWTGEGKLTPSWSRGRHSIQAVLGSVITLQERSGGPRLGYAGKTLPASERDANANLRLGYQYRIREGWWASAQAGNAYRLPTFLEKYGDRGSVLGNPLLKPESGLNGSVGLHGEGRGWSAETQAFASEGRDIITLEQTAQFTLVFRNLDLTRILGAEARFNATPRPSTRSELDLTFQQAVNATQGSSEQGKLLPYRPVSQASVRQVFTRAGWTLAGTGYYQGLAYPGGSNMPGIFDSYSHNTDWQTRCDLDLSWRARHLLLAAGVRNVFDQHAFDFFNIPLPGRSFAATVQAEL